MRSREGTEEQGDAEYFIVRSKKGLFLLFKNKNTCA